MTEIPLLDFYRHGHVTQDKEWEIRHTLEDCYRRLSSHPLPEKVEVRLCQTPSQLADFLQTEKNELGIQTLGDESFICSHDAWRDFPRVLVCMERLFALSDMARLGTLRHEAAHTVLHGALAYYVFRIPPDCLELAGLMQLEVYANSMLSYIDPEERKRLLITAANIARQLGDDTHNNVRVTLKQVLRDLL